MVVRQSIFRASLAWSRAPNSRQSGFLDGECRESSASFNTMLSDVTVAPPTRKDGVMRYMLIQNYGGVELECTPMSEWTPSEVKAHIEFQIALNQELGERGELVDAQGLAGPDQAKFVLSDGVSAPVVTDGPFPEGKELLAGYRVVDVDTPQRAIELAEIGRAHV